MFFFLQNFLGRVPLFPLVWSGRRRQRFVYVLPVSHGSIISRFSRLQPPPCVSHVYLHPSSFTFPFVCQKLRPPLRPIRSSLAFFYEKTGSSVRNDPWVSSCISIPRIPELITASFATNSSRAPFTSSFFRLPVVDSRNSPSGATYCTLVPE